MADTTDLMQLPIDFCTKDVENLSTLTITDANDGWICRICEKVKYSPRLLGCLHSFCTDCIFNLNKNGNDSMYKKNNEGHPMCTSFCNYSSIGDTSDSDKENNWKSPNGNVRCPICFQMTTLNELKIEDVLPLDYPIIQLLDKSKYVPNSEICKICNKGDKAVAACESCKHICEQCVIMHKHVSVFQNHKVKLLSEISPNGGAPSKRDSLDCECGQKKVTYFCDDCEAFICNLCLGKHNNHTVNESSTWNSVGLCNQFEDFLKLIGKESANAETLLSSEAEMKACDEYFAVGIGKIEFIHERLADSLNNWKNDMVHDLERRKIGLKEMFTKLRFNWSLLNEKEHHMGDFIKNLVTPNLDKELWKLKKPIFEQANYLINEYKKFGKNTKIGIPLQSTEYLKTSIHNYLTKCLILVWNSFSSDVDDNLKHHVSNNNYSFSQLPMNINDQNSYNGTHFDFNIHYSNSSPREYRSHVLQYNNGSGDCEYDGNTSEIIPSSSNYGETFCDNYNSKNVRNSDLSVSQNVEGNNFVRNIQERPKDYSWTQYNTNAPIFTPSSNNNQKLSMNGMVSFVSCPNGTYTENSTVSPCHNAIYNISNDTNSSPNNSLPDVDTPLYSLNPMSPTYNKKFSFPNGSNSLPPPSPLMTTTLNNAGLFGNPPEQLNAPHGLSIGRDEDVVVCDTNNHRIVIFSAKMQHFVFGSGGCEEGLLYYPKKIVTFQVRGNWMHIILDRGAPSRLQIFTYDGMFKCRFNSGINSDNINAMSFDEENETLLIIDNKGIITGFGVDLIPEVHRRLVINCGRHIREPSDVLYNKGYYYISDYKSHNVCVFDNQANLVKKFGNSSISPYPVGLSITSNDIILVGDSHGNRYHISGFNIDGILVTEHECPDVKVSRCVGLKVGSDGNIITVSKQNNLVLVFNPLQNITIPTSTFSSPNMTSRFHI